MRKQCLLLLICCTFFACRPKSEPDIRDRNMEVFASFKRAADSLPQDPQLRLAFWNSQLSSGKFDDNNVLRSRLHYTIAGIFYGLHEPDSLKKHMQLAWSLMGEQRGYPGEKVLLYMGMGNIAQLDRKIHQEHYYYNQAAQLLLSDSTIALAPETKAGIFLAAGQSSETFRQMDNAFAMNRHALKLLQQVPENYNLVSRAYSQMAALFTHAPSDTAQQDSLYAYIRKMEMVCEAHPDKGKLRFIFEKKAQYFMIREVIDSMLYYQRKCIALDVRALGEDSSSMARRNLFISYVSMLSGYVYLKKTDSASFYLKQCFDLAAMYPDIIDEECKRLYHSSRLDYLFLTRQYKEAETEQEIVIRSYKQLYENENVRAATEMGALFQLQAKDRSIYHLNETVTATRSRLQQNRLWLAVAGLTTLLSVSIALLLYFILRQRKLRAATEKILLEQRLLRTQMEPHFIFNTLSALQSFIRFDKREKALKYLNQFGHLLRSSLQLSRESLVPLSEEADTLEHYLSLQQMRYDDAFSYSIHLPEDQDIESVYIPPMLVQPFVENAILHGIDPNGRDGVITLDFDIREDTLLVSIADNGRGIAGTAAGSSHQSLSTAISRERLAMLARESKLPADIRITSDPGTGTLVKLTIPVRTAVKRPRS